MWYVSGFLLLRLVHRPQSYVCGMPRRDWQPTTREPLNKPRSSQNWPQRQVFDWIYRDSLDKPIRLRWFGARYDCAELISCTHLPLQAEQHNDVVEGLREKWHVAHAENQTLSARVETLERWGEEGTDPDYLKLRTRGGSVFKSWNTQSRFGLTLHKMFFDQECKWQNLDVGP